MQSNFRKIFIPSKQTHTKMYRRSDGTIDQLLDASGVLIPKKAPPLYSKEELSSLMGNKPAQIKALAKTNTTRVFDKEIENEPFSGVNSSNVSFDFAINDTKSNNFDRLLLLEDIADIFHRFYGEGICSSMLTGKREWLDMAWERRTGGDLFIYKKPRGIYMDALPSPNGDPSVKMYKYRKLQCDDIIRIKIGSLPSNTAIPVKMANSDIEKDFYSNVIRRSEYECLLMPDMFINLPEYFSIWPVAFEIKSDCMMMKGQEFSTYRGVKEIKE